MFSNWIYVLIGRNKTGKTSFQRHLVNYLCDNKLTNVKGHRVVKLRAPEHHLSLYVANRSYQEVARGKHGSVENYFDAEVFNGASRPDVVILSSHSDTGSIADVEEIIRLGRLRCYNIAGLFFSNDDSNGLDKIKLDCTWDERLWINNPRIKSESEEKIQGQLQDLAIRFGDLLIHRSTFQ